MLGFPILYCKGMRPMMFQLSGFCYKALCKLRFVDLEYPKNPKALKPQTRYLPEALKP